MKIRFIKLPLSFAEDKNCRKKLQVRLIVQANRISCLYFTEKCLNHNKNWEHIVRRHPDISSEKEKIVETLENPDKIVNSIKDENARFYYKHYKYRNSVNKFMTVLVKYLNNHGFVITAYFVRHM